MVSCCAATGLDDSILDKLDRLRISEPRVMRRSSEGIVKLRSFTSLANLHNVTGHGRLSPHGQHRWPSQNRNGWPSILDRRSKSSCGQGASSPHSLSIDPQLTAGLWGGSDAPLAPRSFGSANSGNSAWSAVGSSLDSWQGLSCAGLDSHDSGPSAGGNLGHNCDRELFLDA